MGIEVGVKVSNQNNVLGTSMYDCRHCIDQRLSCTAFFSFTLCVLVDVLGMCKGHLLRIRNCSCFDQPTKRLLPHRC